MAADSTDHGSGLDTFQPVHHQHASQSRRMRPTEMGSARDGDTRIPLRTEKLNRRESRLGLRNIFGRPKTGNEEEAKAKEFFGRSAGIRASLTSNWPYGSQGHRSEIVLPFRGPSSPTTSSPTGNDHLGHKKSVSAVKAAPSSPQPTQRATWDPPPLFQAYPQAVKHCSLPACTLPTEVILRHHSQREGLEELVGDKASKSRRTHKRNKSGSSFKTDWTTKIFVLVTSGYLLQYAGEGTFDRLPERMLRLGKDSAAFVSDVIPGRHWVLQVSSVTDMEGPTTSPSTSLFSRLSLRGTVIERRQAANFLMVFDSAEAMESWIVVLRREIEALGGKKNLSETGKPKMDDGVLRLRTQTSQRTLVTRESSRLSKVLSQELPWDQAAAMANTNFRLSTIESDAGRDQSFDNTSTASVISQDGRRLDGLRDSTQRLSYMSSGQRTMITSPGSSPASSPLRDSFGSQPGTHFEDLSLDDQEQMQDATPGPRLRPNASAILDRRQSMQTANHLAEMRVASVVPRPFFITYASTSWQSQPQPSGSELYASSPQNIPNFSVPQVLGTRFPIPSPPEPTSHQFAGLPRPQRRPPPSAISINPRPLSLVVDHPSPNPSTPGSLDNGELQLTLPEELVERLDHQVDIFEPLDMIPSPVSSAHSPIAGDSDGTMQFGLHKHNTSITTIRESIIVTSPEDEEQVVTLSSEVTSARRPRIIWTDSATSASRPKSSLDNYRSSTSTSLFSSSAPGSTHAKRFSLQTTSSQTVGYRQSVDSEVSVTITSVTAKDSIREHNPILFTSTATNPRLSIDGASKTLMGMRSMTHLTDIPPPAPPPTRALPPLPVARST